MQYLRKLNLPLLIIPVFIYILGLITLFSTAPGLVKNHVLFFLISAVVYYLVTRTDYKVFLYLWKYFYYVTLALLVVTFFLGAEEFGSVRRFYIGFFGIQSSELAKLAIILALPAIISVNRSYTKKLSLLAKILFFFLPIFIAVLLQPDLGTSIVLFVITVGILFFSGIDRSYFLLFFIFLGFLSDYVWQVLKPYQKRRVLVFLNPQLDLLGSGYNVMQSIIAIGSGQLFGRGFGQGTQTHLKFLPVYWTDFIFAAFAEEWGFVGVLILLFLFCALFLSVLYVVKNVKDTYGALVVVGVFLMLFSQVLVNVGMNLGLLPVTGIPLPFVSYGGSSLLTSIFLLGLVQSVWIHRKV